MTDAGQCPGCNRYSDRDDCIKELDGDFQNLSADRYFACLGPDCEVYMFPKGGSSGFKLNVKGIRDSGRYLLDVKHEKLEEYEFKD